MDVAVHAMARPAIKPTHVPYRVGDTIRIGGPAVGPLQEIQDPTGAIWVLTQAMDGTRTVEEIIDKVRGRSPLLTAADVLNGIRVLTDNGHVENAAAPPPAGLDGKTMARHTGDRDLYSWIDREPRDSPWHWLDRLRQAQVTIIGVGGSGCTAAEALVRAGAGAVHLIDPDIVELGNLSRQSLYTEQDVGQPKLAAAIRRLGLIDSQCFISGEEVRVGSQDGIALLAEECDTLLLAADEPAEIRQWCNRACWKTGTPWVDCGYAGPVVEVRSFVPGEGACWECLIAPSLPRRPVELATHPEDLTGPARPVPAHPTSAVTAGMSGLMAAWHVIARITGIPPMPSGTSQVIDLLNTSRSRQNIAVGRPGCVVCG